MSRRRRRKDFSLSFDSLLDILSNVVGLMVVIAGITALDSRNVTISLGTPILRDPPQGAKRILFECRDNRVVPVDEQAIDKSIIRCLKTYQKKNKGKRATVGDLARLFKQADVGSKCYRVEVDAGRNVAFLYQPRQAEQGEPGARIRKPGSDYGRIINSLDAERQFVFFIVRSDSFEVFRTARRIARDLGLATGWHPIAPDDPLRFNPSGGVGSQIQ